MKFQVTALAPVVWTGIDGKAPQQKLSPGHRPFLVDLPDTEAARRLVCDYTSDWKPHPDDPGRPLAPALSVTVYDTWRDDCRALAGPTERQAYLVQIAADPECSWLEVPDGRRLRMLHGAAPLVVQWSEAQRVLTTARYGTTLAVKRLEVPAA